jgi:hypothetical protein
MNAQERLNKWHLMWRITKNVVTCRQCSKTQDESDKLMSFVDTSICLTAREKINPWHELAEIRGAASA